MALITAGMEIRFGLSEGQTAVLGRAASALRASASRSTGSGCWWPSGTSRGCGWTSRSCCAARCVGWPPGSAATGLRIGLLSGGRLRFPDELTTDSTWVVPEDAGRTGPRPSWAPSDPAIVDAEVLACPLSVKDLPAGVLLTRPDRRLHRARPLTVRVAGQPAVHGHGERAALPPDRRAVPPVHVPGRGQGTAGRSGEGRTGRRGGAGDRVLRGSARVHRLLREGHPRADRRRCSTATSSWPPRPSWPRAAPSCSSSGTR